MNYKFHDTDFAQIMHIYTDDKSMRACYCTCIYRPILIGILLGNFVTEFICRPIAKCWGAKYGGEKCGVQLKCRGVKYGSAKCRGAKSGGQSKGRKVWGQ